MRYFLAVAEERNFTRAAIRCHVAQPSLSKQIREMENCLGAKLFERLPREIKLTVAGEMFAREAVAALEHSHRAVSFVRALKQDHRLKIGLSALCDLPRIQRLVQAAQGSMEHLSLECMSASSPDLLAALIRGKLDLAVVDLPMQESSICTVRLWSEPLAAVVPQKHPSPLRSAVLLSNLSKHPFVLVSQDIDPASASVVKLLQDAGVESSSIHCVSSLIDLLDFVVARPSVGLIRSSATRLHRDGVVSRPISDSIQLETAIAWRKENRSPLLLSFRDALIAFHQQSSTP